MNRPPFVPALVLITVLLLLVVSCLAIGLPALGSVTGPLIESVGFAPKSQDLSILSQSSLLGTAFSTEPDPQLVAETEVRPVSDHGETITFGRSTQLLITGRAFVVTFPDDQTIVTFLRTVLEGTCTREWQLPLDNERGISLAIQNTSKDKLFFLNLVFPLRMSHCDMSIGKTL